MTDIQDSTLFLLLQAARSKLGHSGTTGKPVVPDYYVARTIFTGTGFEISFIDFRTGRNRELTKFTANAGEGSGGHLQCTIP